MYRIAITRLTGPASRSLIRTAAIVHRPSVRFESSAPKSLSPEERKAFLERLDDLRRDWDAPTLTYDELKPKTQNPSPDKYLIDVREPDEVMQGMIPSAVNIPLSELGASLRLSKDAFRAKHGFEKPKQDQEVVFYCRSGMRSRSASDVAKRNGYKNIYNYQGSWIEWIKKESA